MLTGQESLLKVAEVAGILRVSRSNVRKFISEGRLVASNMGIGSHKIWRIRREELNRFITQSEQSDTSGANQKRRPRNPKLKSLNDLADQFGL